jgi:hypothetical protein
MAPMDSSGRVEPIEESSAVATPPEGDFMIIGDERWTDVKVAQHGDSFRTDLWGKATRAVSDKPSEVAITIIKLNGPGSYPFGFAWSRGDTRASVGPGNGCMTPGGDGAVTITEAPADGLLVPGARLAGTFRIACTPEAKRDVPPTIYTGSFAVTVRTAPAR